jgi:uncharacterized YigZ family protein
MPIPCYLTLQKDTETEIVIQKSRFLCYARHIQSEDEAQQFLGHIQKKHWDATHHCYAYRITHTLQKASDDGEPSGTAGRPILHVITKNELLYTLIVITRYFGGVKLGGGGLVRAYSQGASEVISAAKIKTMSQHQQLFLSFAYTHLSKIEHGLHRSPYYVEPLQYEETVQCMIWVPLDEVEEAKKKIEAWTSGQVTMHTGKTAYYHQKS